MSGIAHRILTSLLSRFLFPPLFNQQSNMRRSEYQVQAFVNDGMNQQHSMDSPEGSAALVQANKPEVDATDMQKERILAKDEEKQAAQQAALNLLDIPKRNRSRPVTPVVTSVSPRTKRT